MGLLRLFESCGLIGFFLMEKMIFVGTGLVDFFGFGVF